MDYRVDHIEISSGPSNCSRSNALADARLESRNQLDLPYLPEKSATDRRVELAVAPFRAWPDGDWYTPCEPDRADFDEDLVLTLASTYNSLLCSIIRNSITACAAVDRWSRVGLDLVLGGVNPHKVSELVEQRVRALMVEWMIERGLFAGAHNPGALAQPLPSLCRIGEDLVMESASDGDIAFWRALPERHELLAIVVICSSVDSAQALEQYNAAAGWFRGALAAHRRCENILLSVDDSAALEHKIHEDGLVAQHWNVMPLLACAAARKEFFTSLFRSTLGLLW